MSVTLYDSLAQSQNNFGALVWSGTCFSGHGVQAFSFTPSTNALLSSLTVVYSADLFIGSGVNNFTVALYNDNGSNLPGLLNTMLATVTTGPGFTPTATVIPLTANPNVSSGTRYWIVFSAGAGDSTDISTATSGGTGTAGEYHAGCSGASFTSTLNGSGSILAAQLLGSNLAIVPPGNVITTVLPALWAGFAPVIACDLHGMVVVYAEQIAQGSPSVNYPVLTLAFSNDLANLLTWTFLTLWDWSADTGPPPPDLAAASGIGGLWLCWDFVDICCGRGYLSVSAKANLGSPVTPSAFQELYVGILQWNSILVP